MPDAEILSRAEWEAGPDGGDRGMPLPGEVREWVTRQDATIEALAEYVRWGEQSDLEECNRTNEEVEDFEALRSRLQGAGWIESYDPLDDCPICRGGDGRACDWHFL